MRAPASEHVNLNHGLVPPIVSQTTAGLQKQAPVETHNTAACGTTLDSDLAQPEPHHNAPVTGGNPYDCLSNTDIDRVLATYLGPRYVDPMVLVRFQRAYCRDQRFDRSTTVAW